MDPLSIIASIIAIVEITGTVIAYIDQFRGAQKSINQYEIEIYNLSTLLLQLKSHLNESSPQEPWYAAVQALDVKDGPFHQYLQALKSLVAKVNRNKGKMAKFQNILMWKFVEPEVSSIMKKLERLKTSISTALELDHL